MSEEDERKHLSEEQRERLQEGIDEIKDELKEGLEDIKDEIDDISDDLKEQREELKDEFESEIEDLEDEIQEKLLEGSDPRIVLEYFRNKSNEMKTRYELKIQKLANKAKKAAQKFTEKSKKKMEKAERKAVRRINISVEPELSDDWKDWAEGLGTSVSELVRKSMEFVKDNIGDIKKLERIGEYFEELGGDLELTLKESGLENIGKVFEKKYPSHAPHPPAEAISSKKVSLTEAEKEIIKKRIQGIIKLHNAIPLDKLALAMNKKVEDAEALIYELAGRGLDGNLEDGVFKFTGDADDVISRFDKRIDEM